MGVFPNFRGKNQQKNIFELPPPRKQHKRNKSIHFWEEGLCLVIPLLSHLFLGKLCHPHPWDPGWKRPPTKTQSREILRLDPREGGLSWRFSKKTHGLKQLEIRCFFLGGNSEIHIFCLWMSRSVYPIGSMYSLYLPTFTININQM